MDYCGRYFCSLPELLASHRRLATVHNSRCLPFQTIFSGPAWSCLEAARRRGSSSSPFHCLPSPFPPSAILHFESLCRCFPDVRKVFLQNFAQDSLLLRFLSAGLPWYTFQFFSFSSDTFRQQPFLLSFTGNSYASSTLWLVWPPTSAEPLYPTSLYPSSFFCSYLLF